METRIQKTALDQFWKENCFPQTISGNGKLGQTSKMWSQRERRLSPFSKLGVWLAALSFCAVSGLLGIQTQLTLLRCRDKPSEN